MKKYQRSACILPEWLEDRRLLSLTAELVADISQHEAKSGDVRYITEFNKSVYFTADDGVNGRQLWRSDGTPDGTAIFLNRTAPGFGSDIDELVVVGDQLYFRYLGDNGAGTELWKTDGTEAGTMMVKDLHPGPGGLRPYLLTEAGGLLYFFTRDDQNVTVTLWKSDGTEMGTMIVSTIASAYLQGREPTDIREVDGKVFFEVNNDLWVTDGTQAGTELLREFLDMPPHLTQLPQRQFVELNGQLYFHAADVEHGRELWTSDGTDAGTVLVKDIRPGVYSSADYQSQAVATSDALYFSADDGDPNTGLWTSGGTPEGTRPWDVDLLPAGAQIASNVTPLVDRLLFLAHEPSTGVEPWVSDGTSEGTLRLADVYPGELGIYTNFFVHDGIAYFSAYDGNANALWRTDGTPEGTAMAANWSSSPQAFAAGQFFGLTRDDAHGEELWAWDGTLDGAALLRDIRLGNAGSNLQPLAGVGDALLLAVTPPNQSRQLWVTDDSLRGASYLMPLPVVNSAPPMTPSGDLTYFVATDEGIAGAELWRTDGTAIGTFRLTDLKAGPANTFFTSMVAAPGGLYFVATSDAYGGEVFFTDGTVEGTRVVRDIRAGADSSNPTELKMVGDRLFFAADGDRNGPELWTSDGTADGTHLVKVIQQPDPFGVSRFKNFTEFQGLLYFSTRDVPFNEQLWRSDGTAEGTYRITQIGPEPTIANITDLRVVGDRLMFRAADPEHSSEFWVSDGTPEGTSMVVDLKPGPQHSAVTIVGVAGSQLFFTFNDGTHGEEIWRTDGTAEGTRIVADLVPGGSLRPVVVFKPLGDRMFFTMPDSFQNRQLWVTDGTSDGTQLALPFPDFRFGFGVNSPLTYRGQLFFTGDDGVYGHELWRLVRSPGDTNFDGQVNIEDLNNVRNNFGYAGYDRPGDADGDGVVGIEDLNAVRNHFGAGGAQATWATRRGVAERSAISTPRDAAVDVVFRQLANETTASDKLAKRARRAR
jgi:ELWxxDGT repeat protein